MKERPILFSSAMVRAILDGRKTQTRRVVKGLALEWLTPDMCNPEYVAASGMCPYGQPSDQLWARETWAQHPDEPGVIWRATDPGWDDNDYGIKWRPSIFMPRWASRITLEIVSVRVERVQDISADDAEAEGVGSIVPTGSRYDPRDIFYALWDQINEKRGYGWDVNPWVWVVTFRKVTT